MMRRIRLKHPIFHLLTINAFKYLFENGILFKVNTIIFKIRILIRKITKYI